MVSMFMTGADNKSYDMCNNIYLYNQLHEYLIIGKNVVFRGAAAAANITTEFSEYTCWCTCWWLLFL